MRKREGRYRLTGGVEGSIEGIWALWERGEKHCVSWFGLEVYDRRA